MLSPLFPVKVQCGKPSLSPNTFIEEAIGAEESVVVVRTDRRTRLSSGARRASLICLNGEWHEEVQTQGLQFLLFKHYKDGHRISERGGGSGFSGRGGG